MTKAVRAHTLSIFLLVLAVLLGIAAFRPIDHDEGQYVAEIGDEGVDHPFPFGTFVYLDDRHIVPCKARLRLRADTGSLRRHWK